jgi:hypothetical protein
MADIPSVQVSTTAIKLDTATFDDDLHIVDNDDIVAGNKYYYYVWLETKLKGEDVAFAGRKETIIASAQETFQEYVDRKEKIEANKERLRKATQPAPALVKEPDPVEAALAELDIRADKIQQYEKGRNLLRKRGEEQLKTLPADTREALLREQERELQRKIFGN